MKLEELQHSTIFEELKKNEKVQQSALRLGKTMDWAVLKQFVAKLKQILLEATLETDSLDDIKRYKHIIWAMEGIVKLPELVGTIKEIEKEDEIKKEEEEREAKRRKYNPGAFIRTAVEKVRRVVK